MTDDERDALIEKAAEAMVEYDNPGVNERGDVIADWDDYVGAARAAFAVFEQAHTPTDDERARVIEELRWLAEARKKYETDTFPSIAREVQTTLHLADILERRMPVAEGGQGFGWIPSWLWEEWDRMVARRTVQGEPTAAQVDAAAREAFFTDDAGGHIRGGWTWDTIPEQGRENYRTMVRGVLHAALRAAAAVREEGGA